MKINRKTVLTTATVLGAAALMAGGTIAYFTDSESKVNKFEVGSVDITLYESSLHRTNAGRKDGTTLAAVNAITTGTIVDGKLTGSGIDPDTAGTSSKYPGSDGCGSSCTFYTNDQIKADAATYNTTFTDVLPGFTTRKAAYVENTGDSDAYVRIKYLFPASIFELIDENSYFTRTATDSGAVISSAIDLYFETFSTYSSTEYANYITAMETAGNVAYRNSNNETCTKGANGCVEYLVFDYIYRDALESGEMTFWNPWGSVGIASRATAEDIEDFNIIVEADGIQATGFDSATAAFAAYDAQNN